MSKSEIIMIGDFLQEDQVDFEGALTFNVKSASIEKKVLWKSKDITAEFLGQFWENMLSNEDIKESLHFIVFPILAISDGTYRLLCRSAIFVNISVNPVPRPKAPSNPRLSITVESKNIIRLDSISSSGFW